MPFPTLSVCRELASQNINAIVNDISVRPCVGGGVGAVDLTPLVANPANVLLMGHGGGVLFQQLEPGLYEAHTQFLPDARGKNAVAVVRDALRWMFARWDAVEIVTKVPDGNVGALGLVRAIHGQLLFRREKVWPLDGKMVGVGYYTLPILTWAGKAPELAEAGIWFHEKLEAAKIATAGAAPLHDDDEAHDRYVGATAEMFAFGQVDKALAFYGRWSRFAGYGPITVIAANPIVIDIGDALLAVRGQDFEVLLCR